MDAQFAATDPAPDRLGRDLELLGHQVGREELLEALWLGGHRNVPFPMIALPGPDPTASAAAWRARNRASAIRRSRSSASLGSRRSLPTEVCVLVVRIGRACCHDRFH